MNNQRLDQLIRRQRKHLIQDVLFAISVSAAVAASLAALQTM